MSETTSATTPPAGTAAAPQAGITTVEVQTPQAGTTPAGQTPAPETVDALPKWAQDLIKEVRGEAAGHRTKLQAIEAERTKAEQAEAVKRGEWEKVATDRQAEIDRLSGEVAKRDRDALVARIATAHKLPAELADLLQGEDETALADHAKRLAKLVKPAGAPDTEGGSANRGGASRPNAAANGKPQDGKTPAYSFLPAGAVPIPD